ncbi:MAG TPA: hypothetical protein VFH80_17700 [Solirubrobacteraceae bacterium]|nr:hypothetical protein [Solirubrobacteraceae bacterium]
MRTPRVIAPAGTDTAVARRSINPALLLQRKIGNRATGQLLARAPATKEHGSVKIGKLPAIKIVGGNAGDWTKNQPNTLEITSTKGKHSAALERLSRDGSKIPTLKVTTPIDQSGQHLDFGSVELEFSHATIADYAVDGKVETWRAVDFNRVHRNTISHRTGI